jgi:hypothetical protein
MHAAGFQFQYVPDAGGHFPGMMRDEDEVGAGSIDNPVHIGDEGATMEHVQSLTGFVQDEQSWFFNDGARQQDKALIAEGQFAKRLPGLAG